MAKPSIGQRDWGQPLNDHLDTIEASVATKASIISVAAKQDTATRDADVAADIANAASATSAALSTTMVTVGEGAAETTVGGTPRQVITGNKHHTGLLIFGSGVGSISPSLRIPFHANVIIDGDQIAAAQGPSTFGYDKVGNANNVTARGDFTAEVGFGVNNPTDLLGANDFVVTGSAVGDMVGINAFYGRITELHSYSPDADYVDAAAFSSQMEISGGGHSDNAYSTYVHPPLATSGGTITNGYNLFLRRPTTDSPTNYWSMFAQGKVQGETQVIAGTAARDLLPTSQTTARGVYLGQASGGSVAMLLAEGTKAYNVKVDSTGFVIEKAGTAVLLRINDSGDLIPTGNLAVAAGKSITTDTVTGMKIGGSATQKVGFFGVTPVVQRTAIASPTADVASLKTAVDAIRTALTTLGLTA